MKYLKVRDKIRDGDVLAFRGTRWWSWLIRYFTQSRTSHVGFALWMHGRLCVMEALEGRGIRIFPVSKCLEDGEWIDWYELHKPEDNKIDRDVLVATALSHWGKQYAPWWQFVRTWCRWLRRYMDMRGKPMDVDPERFFCSEFVLTCLRMSGYLGEGFASNLSPAAASPGDIIELPCLHRMGKLEQ